MTFHIITLFPEAFDSYLQESIIGRAVKEKKIKVNFYNPRDYAAPRPGGKKLAKKDQWFYRLTDDKPYGGGPGMVMTAEPILKAVEVAKRKILSTKSEILNNNKARNSKIKTIIFSPSGKKFTNELGRAWVKKYEHLILICGRYEG